MRANGHDGGSGMTSSRTRERLVRRLAERGIQDQRVLQAIREVPRHQFVDPALASRAYEDDALPIGHEQTISQPYVVAYMTECLLNGDTPGKVLEVGTGSGYQTAVLAQLVPQVFSVERIEPLLEQARARLRELGIRSVRFRHGDGSLGWSAQAPFDGILLTAAPEGVPDRLLEQLAEGGRLVAPVGSGGDQALLRVTRTATGYRRERLGAVSFVPLREGTS